MYRSLTLTELTTLIDIPEGAADNLMYLEQLIKQCGSFLTIRESTVYFVYQSAQDFVLKNASNEIFFSGTTVAYYDIYFKSVIEMSSLKKNVYDLQDFSASRTAVEISKKDPLRWLRYSCVYFIDHLLAMDKCFEETEICDEEELRQFFEKHYLHWLEALSLIGSMSDGIKAINRLLIQIQVGSTF